MTGRTCLDSTRPMIASGLAGACLMAAALALSWGRPAHAAATKTKDDAPPPVRVRVVAEDRPVAGARVVVANQLLRPGERGEGTTDADGRLEFPATDGLRAVLAAGLPLQIHATAPGRGAGWAYRTEWTDPVVIALPAEGTPIRGRLRDSQGKPIVDARVRVLMIYHDGDLPVPAALPADPAPLLALHEPLHLGNDDDDPLIARDGDPTIRQAVTTDRDRLRADWITATDAEGRFTLPGLGPDRAVDLRITHPSISSIKVTASTRPGPTEVIPGVDGAPGFTKSGPDLDLTAVALRVITGVVRDTESGRPLANWDVCASTRDDFPGFNPSRSRTDANGRYRCEVSAHLEFNTLGFDPPPGQPYLFAYFGREPSNPRFQDPKERRIKVPPGANTPVTFDHSAPRVPVVRGRVTDAATGRPVAGVLSATPMSDWSRSEARKADGQKLRAGRTDADGRFALAVPPGRVVISFNAQPTDLDPDADPRHPPPNPYLTGQGADRIPGYDPTRQVIRGQDPSESVYTRDGTAYAEVVAQLNQPDPTCDFRLVTGRSVALTALDPEGRPLPAAEVEVRVQYTDWRGTAASGTATTLPGFAAGEARPAVVRHRGRNLAGIKLVRIEDGPEQTIQLDRCGSIRGRILLPDSNPPPHGRFTDGPNPAKTGAQLVDITGSLRNYVGGRFVITGLVPGLHYTASFERTDGLLEIRTPIEGGVFCTDLMIRPGEDRDMGDVRLTQPAR